MPTGEEFDCCGAQILVLSNEARFPSDVRTVYVRFQGKDRIISQIDCRWDGVSLGVKAATTDFCEERASQGQAPTEPF